MYYSNGRRLLISKHLSSNNFFFNFNFFRPQLILNLIWMITQQMCEPWHYKGMWVKFMWCSEWRSWNR